MQLKKLEISGFKSFRDRVILDFAAGINAVVGPNGCGKSNVVDAVRWVMGEQRVRLLRGKKMDDVIFHGSQEVAAVGMAEIVMTLAGDGTPFPDPFAACTEIAVSRRIYRDGESEYAINRQPCRLTDVREFFLDTGVGVRTYSIVEQNSVAGLVEAKPEERRQFVEEAAGIAKYKSRKESAQRKMEAARENLTRLRDIIREVRGNLTVMGKQAKRAEQYRALRRDIREAEVLIGLHAYQDLADEREKRGAALAALQEEHLRAQAGVQAREAEREARRAELLAGEAALAECQQRLYQLKNDVYAREKDIALAEKQAGDAARRQEQALAELGLLGERREAMEREHGVLAAAAAEVADQVRVLAAELETDAARAERLREEDRHRLHALEERKAAYIDVVAEKAKLKNSVAGLTRLAEDLRRREERGDRETAEHQERIAALEKCREVLDASLASARAALGEEKERQRAHVEELQRAQEERRRIEEETARLREELGAASARFASLREFHDGYTWCSEGTKSILKACRQERPGGLAPGAYLGLVADHIDTPAEYEAAVEAVLGDKLQYIVVKSQDEGVKAIGYLKRQALGRSSFVPVQVRTGHGAGGPPPSGEGVPLRQCVTASPAARDIVDCLLGEVVLIPDLEAGLSLWRRNGFAGTFVTRDGDIISPAGILTGGGRDREVSLLRIKREIGELGRQTGALQASLAAARERAEQCRTLIRALEEEQARSKAAVHKAELDIHGRTKDRERLEAELGLARQRVRILEGDREAHAAERQDIDAKIAAATGGLQSVEAQDAAMQQAMAALQREREELAARLRQDEGRLTEKRIRLASLEERRSGGIKARARLEEDLQTTRREMDVRQRDAAAADSELQALREQAAREQEIVSRAYGELAQAEEALQQQRDAHARQDQAARAGEAAAREAQKACERIAGQVQEIEIALHGLDVQIETLTKNMRERFAAELESAAGKDFQRLAEVQLGELRRRAAAQRQVLEEFGEVNLLATNEYERLKERYDFLAAQEKDLITSLATLERTITRINSITKQRFAETFAAVNGHFKTVFGRIFPGGKGELSITDETDLLETGVDIFVQIPGKRAQSVSLLSGGEKSLAAIALIFAILLHRPSPFLLLDEVDAALDDANVSLFTDLVRDISSRSQIIMVTHNKRSMEAAGALIGVTMQKQGISASVSVSMH
jgi:chromosome segregation protein